MKQSRISDQSRARSVAVLGSLALFFALSLGGCGQRGPLYLPDNPESAEATTVPGPGEPTENRDNTENEENDEKTP